MKDGSEIRLKQIYKEIEGLSSEIPSELNRMIMLYSQSLMIIGYLDAKAMRDYNRAYAERKAKEAEVKKNFKGTGVEKEAQAELEIRELRIIEGDLKAKSREWTNVFNSTEHMIIALRRGEKALMTELQQTDGTGGNYA